MPLTTMPPSIDLASAHATYRTLLDSIASVVYGQQDTLRKLLGTK